MSASEQPVKTAWFPLLAFVVFAASIFVAGMGYYYIQVQDIRLENRSILSAIAELKIMQIVQWRQSNMQDALLLANDPLLVENMGDAFFDSKSVASTGWVLSLLRRTRKAHSYQNIIIYDRNGAQLFAALAGNWPKPEPALVSRALQKRQPVCGDLVRDGKSGMIYLDIVTVIPGLPGKPAGFEALLVLRIDPQDTLFSLIQAWPTKSSTAETLLVRGDGDEVVFLNELRHAQNTALLLQASKQEKDLPAARAARGEMDGLQGIDYRGKKVIWTAKKVPGSSWLMIAKMDDEEILSRLRLLALVAGIIFIVSMTAVGGFIYVNLKLRRSFDIRREADLKAATRDLTLRVKELNCLYGISSVVERYGDSLDAILSEVVTLLPQAWEFPEITCVRITVEGRQYASESCLQTPWEQSADIIVQGQCLGRVEVFHRECLPSAHADADIVYPRVFISEVAERISLTVQRFKAQEALRESLARLSAIMSCSPMGIYLTDEHGDCLFANQKWCELSGLTQQDAQGDGWLAGIHPDDRSSIRENWYRSIRTGGAWGHEYRFLDKSGRVTWVFGTAAAISDETGRHTGYVGINADITERRQKEAEIRLLNLELEKKVAERTDQLQQALDTLRDSEERYRTIADFTCDWEFWVSPERKYLFISPSFESMTGYPAQSLYDDFNFLATIVHPDDRSLITSHMEANEQTHVVPIDFRIITRDGRERWISHLCQQVFAADGRFLGMRGSNRDITETKKLRDEAIRDAHLASIGRLAAGMAHEINNPISGVINYAQIIRTKCSLEDKYREFLDDLISEAERVAIIVKDLLLFARPHSGAPIRSDLRDIFGQTFSLVAKQLDKNFVTVKAGFLNDLPDVLVRPQQIMQVFLNFFMNAVYALNKKFSGPDPGKILDISGEQVDLDGKVFVRVTFHDHGIGIPADMLDRVCDPFFSTKAPGEGTGLGLSISYTIIKEHGGRLHIASNEGEYTKAIVELPAAEGAQ